MIVVTFSFFFLQKQNDIHSFKLISTYDTKFVKKVKGESANKLTASKLITYSDKKPTNNMPK